MRVILTDKEIAQAITDYLGRVQGAKKCAVVLKCVALDCEGVIVTELTNAAATITAEVEVLD